MARATLSRPPARRRPPDPQILNGWAYLEKVLGRQPDITPYNFVLSGTLDARGQPTSTITMEDVTDSDSELYIFGTSVNGWSDPDAGEGLHSGALFQNQPEAWWGWCQLFEGDGSIAYSNQVVRTGHLFGTGIRPYLWPVPMILKPSTRLRLTATNNDVEIQNPFFTFHGFKRHRGSPSIPVDIFLEPRILPVLQRYRERGRLGRIEPFFCSMNALMVGFEADQFSVSVTDADFIVCDVMVAVQDANAETYFPSMETLIRLVVAGDDESQDVRLDNGGICFSGWGGVGQRPMRLAYPIVLPQGQDLTAIITNLQASTDPQGSWHNFVTFAGFKIYPPAGRR